MGYWDASYGSHTRDKNSIEFSEIESGNPARCYVIHKCFRSYLKIPLKGNHIITTRQRQTESLGAVNDKLIRKGA